MIYRKNSNRTAPNMLLRGVKESTLVAFIAISVFLILSLFSYSPTDPAWSYSISGIEANIVNMGGYFGAHFADISFYLFGYMAYLLPVLIATIGWLVYLKLNQQTLHSHWFYALKAFGFILTMLATCAISTMHFSHHDVRLPSEIGGGGIIGEVFSTYLQSGFSFIGSTLVLITLFLVGVTLFTNLSWLWLMDVTGKHILATINFCSNYIYSQIQALFHRKQATAEKLSQCVEVQDAIKENKNNVANTEQATKTTKATESLLETKQEKEISGLTESNYVALERKINSNNQSPNSELEQRLQQEEIISAQVELDDESTCAEKEQKKWNAFIDKVIPHFLLKNNNAAQSIESDSLESVDVEKVDPTFNVLSETNMSFEQDFDEDLIEQKHEPIFKTATKPVATTTSATTAKTSASQGQQANNAVKKKIDVQTKAPAETVSKRALDEKQTLLFSHDAIDALPSLSLLDSPQASTQQISKEELEIISRRIEETLANYNMSVAVVAVQQGPVITRFELELAPGIKVSQLTSLSKDLARSFLVISIRVVEVIAGKSTVGIEIPNKHREMVSFYDVLNSKHYTESKFILPLGLGHDISGKPVVADLAKMPHLLVAGTTGSGKSVGVNSMILSMLFHADANDLRLIMIDPKMLELSIYEGIPHLLCPVVTDMMEAANALRWCVAEMERRYKLLSALGVRNIVGYNAKIKSAIEAGEPILDPLFEPNPMQASLRPDELETLPYIVIVIDEFADMMMVVGKKVEELIARLAQKARAAGMHLIIATQRPSVNVITGLIKANIPTRIAFQVSSKIDSRTILDQMGAEALLGNGDMLFLPPGTAMPHRVHGAFVSDEEVHAVVDDLKSKGHAEYIEDILTGASSDGSGGAFEEQGSEMDPLYDQAVAIVIETRKASVSGIQRRLKVGYNRAARMVEDMEAAGLVTNVQSNGQREVIVPSSN